jgi:ornithine cyclodeaminase
VPPPIGLKIHDHSGELHVKSAYLHGSRFFVVKAATGFYDNPRHGLPSGSGLMLMFDALTGFPLVLLQDNGYLTELRTAAAGTLATQMLAIKDFQRVAIIGAGAQARFHLRAFHNAFKWSATSVWSRTRAHAEQLCADMRSQVSCDLRVADSVADAVRDADVVVTVTPSKTPLVQGEWLADHATVIAVGSDEPDKQELALSVWARVDRVVVDSKAQCARLGELHHALEQNIAQLDDCTELGEIFVGRKMGRTGRELIVCDLTGVGAQDAAIAELAYRRLSATAT